MRIVIDVSPLSVPRTGIGNYVRGMVATYGSGVVYGARVKVIYGILR